MSSHFLDSTLGDTPDQRIKKSQIEGSLTFLLCSATIFRAVEFLRRSWLAPVIVVVAIYVVLLFAGSRHYGFNFSYFIRMNDDSAQLYSAHIPSGMVLLTHTSGLDGKEYFLVATDPLMRGQYRITYRFKRILYPLLAWLVSGGSRKFIPAAMVLVNLAMIVGGTTIMAYAIRGKGFSPWLSLLFGFSLGQISGIKNSFTNPTMILFTVAAIVFAEKGRKILSPLSMALAVLANESALAFAGVSSAVDAFQKKWKDAAFMGLSVIPYSLVFWHYSHLGGVPSLGRRSFTTFLGGVVDTFHAATLSRGVIHFAVYEGSSLFFFAFVLAVFGFGLARLYRDRHPFAFLCVYYCAVSLFLNQECWYILNIARYTDPLCPLLLFLHMARPTSRSRFLLAFSAFFSLLGAVGMVIEPPHSYTLS